MTHRAGFRYPVLQWKVGLPIFLGLLIILIVLLVVRNPMSTRAAALPISEAPVRTASVPEPARTMAVRPSKIALGDSVLSATAKTLRLSFEEPTVETSLLTDAWVKFWAPLGPRCSFDVEPRLGCEIYFLDGDYQYLGPDDDVNLGTHRAIFWLRGVALGQMARVSIDHKGVKFSHKLPVQESRPSLAAESYPTTEPATRPAEK